MFVSSMLKKCVDLLSHNPSKDQQKLIDISINGNEGFPDCKNNSVPKFDDTFLLAHDDVAKNLFISEDNSDSNRTFVNDLLSFSSSYVSDESMNDSVVTVVPKILKEHQAIEEIVRLNEKYEPVDTWGHQIADPGFTNLLDRDPDRDLIVNHKICSIETVNTCEQQISDLDCSDLLDRDLLVNHKIGSSETVNTCEYQIANCDSPDPLSQDLIVNHKSGSSEPVDAYEHQITDCDFTAPLDQDLIVNPKVGSSDSVDTCEDLISDDDPLEREVILHQLFGPCEPVNTWKHQIANRDLTDPLDQTLILNHIGALEPGNEHQSVAPDCSLLLDRDLKVNQKVDSSELVDSGDHQITNCDFSEPPNKDLIVNHKKMESSDRIHQLEEQVAELKLQLNASQQVRASLELQLTQKEEIVIKSQTESLRKEQAAKQEIKQLKDKLEERVTENDGTTTKEMQETIKSLKAKLISDMNARKNDEQNFRKVLDDYEKVIAANVSHLQKSGEEHEIDKRHLANLEMAFSDVHQKYERCKKIIDGFKVNETALQETLALSEDNLLKSEQKYDSLKAHAKAQIEKTNQEVLMIRDNYESEVHKLHALVRRLEIKIASLTDSLDQKTKECVALSALCDEVTGRV